MSEEQVNNPCVLVIGIDGALYFSELDHQRIRRLDLNTRRIRSLAGNGQRGYSRDGGSPLEASVNTPHEIRLDQEGIFTSLGARMTSFAGWTEDAHHLNGRGNGPAYTGSQYLVCNHAASELTSWRADTSILNWREGV